MEEMRELRNNELNKYKESVKNKLKSQIMANPCEKVYEITVKASSYHEISIWLQKEGFTIAEPWANNDGKDGTVMRISL